MAEVLVTRHIPGSGIDMIREAGHVLDENREDRNLTREELLTRVAGKHALLTMLADKIDAEMLDAAGDQLQVISNYAVGYNNIDVDEAARRGIRVCNTPGVLTDATADIAWTLLLGVARHAAEGDRMTRAGEFNGWAPELLLGRDLPGKTLAIIGAGRIGTATARRSRGWDMRVIYVSRSRKPDLERELNAEKVELDDALQQADFVSLHVPLTDQTRHLLDERRLGLMKPTAVLINTARGPVVDEAALVRALQRGTISGAGFDVYEDEPRLADGLADCPNTMLLPHLGSATVDTRATMSRLAAENLLAVLSGDPPAHAVN